MRIGLDTTDPQLISPEPAQKSPKPAIGQPEPLPVDDKTSLSADTVSISALATQALNQPEVRQNLVDSLRQSVNSGQYKLDSSAIASAILGE